MWNTFQKKNKITIFYCLKLPKIKYFGQIIDKNGRRPDPSKADTINNMPHSYQYIYFSSWLGIGKLLSDLYIKYSQAKSVTKWFVEKTI